MSGEVAVAFLEIGACDVATQSAARLGLVLSQLGGGNLLGRVLGLSQPVLGGPQNESLFGTGAQDLIDAGEFVAQPAIVDVALDGGQSRSERGLEGEENGGHAAARVYSSFDKATKICTIS